MDSTRNTLLKNWWGMRKYSKWDKFLRLVTVNSWCEVRLSESNKRFSRRHVVTDTCAHNFKRMSPLNFLLRVRTLRYTTKYLERKRKRKRLVQSIVWSTSRYFSFKVRGFNFLLATRLSKGCLFLAKLCCFDNNFKSVVFRGFIAKNSSCPGSKC